MHRIYKADTDQAVSVLELINSRINACERAQVKIWLEYTSGAHKDSLVCYTGVWRMSKSVYGLRIPSDVAKQYPFLKKDKYGDYVPKLSTKEGKALTARLDEVRHVKWDDLLTALLYSSEDRSVIGRYSSPAIRKVKGDVWLVFIDPKHGAPKLPGFTEIAMGDAIALGVKFS